MNAIQESLQINYLPTMKQMSNTKLSKMLLAIMEFLRPLSVVKVM